jgi:hypothetical protein
LTIHPRRIQQAVSYFHNSIIEKSAEHNGVLQNRSAWIFDAMALIQSLKNI